MAVSLDLLRAAVQPIIALTEDEIAFEVEGVHLSLRPMTPKEELAVQRVLTDVSDTEDEDEQFNVMEYFTQFRVETLSYAIVEINGIDLRNETTIATGETTPDGKPIRVAKNIALRGIVEKWPRQVVTLAFTKYGEVVRRSTARVEKFIDKNESDLDSEIERLETRLKQLQQERASRALGNPAIGKEALDNFIQQGEEYDKKQAATLLSGIEEVAPVRDEAIETPTPEPPPAPPAPPEPPAPAAPIPPPPTTPRRSVIPPMMPPPVPETGAPPPTGAVSTLDEFMSSFGGSDDDVAAEEQRLLVARNTRQPTAAPRSTPQVVPDDPRDSLSRAQPAGMIGDVEAYRLPTETLSERGRSAPPTPTLPVNPAPSTGNPNFRPPKR